MFFCFFTNRWFSLRAGQSNMAAIVASSRVKQEGSSYALRRNKPFPPYDSLIDPGHFPCACSRKTSVRLFRFME